MSTLVQSYYAATANPAPARPALAGDVAGCLRNRWWLYRAFSTALHLAERGFKTVLLEAEQVGWGASGRNGGQVNTGLRKGEDLVPLFGREDARRCSHWRRKPRRWCASLWPAMPSPAI